MESAGNNRQSGMHPNHPRPDPSKPRAPRKESYDKHAPKDVLPRKYQRLSGTCQKGEYPCPVIGCNAPMFTRKYALVEHMGRTKGHENDVLAEDIEQETFRRLGPKPAGQLGTGPFIIWKQMQPQGPPPQVPAAGIPTALGTAATEYMNSNNGYVKQESSAFGNSDQSTSSDTQAYSTHEHQHAFSSDFNMSRMPPSHPSQLSSTGGNYFSGGHNFPSGNAFFGDRSYSGDNDFKGDDNL